MLTIREPIALKSLRPMQTIPDSLCQKLNANYALMSAHFTPKDLLFLLTAPPEILETGGGMTNITMLNSAKNTQTVALEVVNNVVNRILMADHSSFTYQDQVYITSVLQKLGITNAAEFMEQVHKLRTENRDVEKLLSLYQDNETILRTLMADREQEKKPAAADRQEEEVPLAQEARYFLHNEIYNRLQTSDIYEIVQEFQHNPNIASKTLHFSELYLAEQQRAGRLLSLSQIKERTLGQKQMNLQYYVNRYEMGSPEEPLQTEQQVLTEGAAAALINLVDQVMVSHAETLNAQEDIWLDIRNAVSQSAENAIMRFEAYHSAPQSSYYSDLRAYELLSTLYQEEITAISQLSQLVRAGGPTTKREIQIFSTQTHEAQMTHYEGMEQNFENIEVTKQGDVSQASFSTEELTNLTKQILQASEQQARVKPAALEEQRTAQQRTRQELERQMMQQPPGRIKEPESEDETPPSLTQEELRQITQPFSAPEQAIDRQEKTAEAQTPEAQAMPSMPLQHRKSDEETQSEDTIRSTELQGVSETSGPAVSAGEAAGEKGKQAVTHIIETELTQSRESMPEVQAVPPMPLQHRKSDEEVQPEEGAVQSTEIQKISERSSPAVSTGEAAGEKGKQAVTHITETELMQSHESTSEITQTVLNTIEREAQRRREQVERAQLEQEAGQPSFIHPVSDSLEEEQRAFDVNQEYAQRIARLNEIQNQILLQQQMYSETVEQPSSLTQELKLQFQQETQQLMQWLQQNNMQQVEQELRQETLIHQQTEEITDLSQTSQETVEQTENKTELLRQQLDQINQRNVELYQQMQNQKKLTQITNVTPDRKRIFNDAMRAIDKPEQVFKELMETSAPMEHPEIPPGMAPMLEQMDQVSRKVYEALLRYERDPQGALAAGLVQRGSAAQLEAQIKAVEREQEELSLTHQIKTEQESQNIVKETTETVLEQWRERPARSSGPPVSESRPKVPIVHKRQENQISEELLERLERQKKEETQKVVTEQVTTKENVVQREVLQMNQEVVAKTTEDITEMINRSLARQIGTISDRVYSQLERRLQTERARRGRL